MTPPPPPNPPPPPPPPSTPTSTTVDFECEHGLSRCIDQDCEFLRRGGGAFCNYKMELQLDKNKEEQVCMLKAVSWKLGTISLRQGGGGKEDSLDYSDQLDDGDHLGDLIALVKRRKKKT